MKIIEAMKRVKANKQKIVDLQGKISAHSAHLSFETPVYPDQSAKVNEWLQACFDTAQENIRLLTSIQRTNMATPVTIQLGEKSVTKSIAEWVWRRREYAAIDLQTYNQLTDRGLKEGKLPTTTGVAQDVTIKRYYDPEERDKMRAIFSREPFEIDGALEVVNATTDLIEA